MPAIIGCVYLFFSLSWETIRLFLIWATIGLVVYFAYSRRRSHVGLGIDDRNVADVPPAPAAPIG